MTPVQPQEEHRSCQVRHGKPGRGPQPEAVFQTGWRQFVGVQEAQHGEPRSHGHPRRGQVKLPVDDERDGRGADVLAEQINQEQLHEVVDEQPEEAVDVTANEHGDE